MNSGYEYRNGKMIGHWPQLNNKVLHKKEVFPIPSIVGVVNSVVNTGFLLRMV